MLASERLVLITNKIIENKIVHVNTLSKEFNVSKMTIRRDLNTLAKEGFIKRTHGGALFNEELAELLDFNFKQQENKEVKREIAEYAASLIHDNDTIAINTSTVTTMLAPFIKDMKITVVTNSLDVINQLSDSKTITLIAVGGTYISKYRSFEGTNTIQEFSDYDFDIAFVGTNGIYDNYIHTGSALEAQAKKVLLKNAKKSYILTENTKWYKKGNHRIAKLRDITVITKNAPLSHLNIIDIAV